MVAMTSGDAETLKAVSLDHPDLELLLTGEKLDQARMDDIRNSVNSMPLTKLNVGDTFKIPQGETITVSGEMANENNVLLTSPGSPLPFTLRKVDGVWRVDAESIIAVRKKANQLRQQ